MGQTMIVLLRISFTFSKVRDLIEEPEMAKKVDGAIVIPFTPVNSQNFLGAVKRIGGCLFFLLTDGKNRA